MSHTIKPIEEDRQQPPSALSPANQNSAQSEDRTSESAPLLSDADYEFLFNQLLEGIAHGWHDRRIIKFFQQLGERGKPEDWVAWLERLQGKLVKLPLQSKQQLGTMMIRLGELTQSATEVQQIGATSKRLGRELLFGNTEDLVWEYAGPDLVIEPLKTKSTPEEISQRLPAEFADLGAVALEDPETNLSQPATPKGKLAPEDEIPPLNLETEAGSQPRCEASPLEQAPDLKSREQLTPTNKTASDSFSEPETVNDFSPEFEFATSKAPDSAIAATPSATEPLDSDPVAIDIEQVMNLIQEDQELAQEISQKLNHSQSTPLQQQLTTTYVEPKPSEELTNHSLDQSSIELIEGWFNLGLKQVSGGEFDKAIVSWEKALKINPHLSEAWHNRGSALGRLGKYQEAVVSFQKALSIDPNNHQAWNDRAHALYQLQNWAAAADSWNNALKITPGNHLFWYNRGCALEQLENWSESIASYEKSLEIKPDFQPARTRYTNLVADNSRAN